MNRLVMVSGTVLAFAFAVAMQQGCSSSDSGSGGSGNTTSGGTGNATSTGGTGNVTSTGGTGNATSTGGTGTSGSTATGGSSAAGASNGGTGGTAAGGTSAGGTSTGGTAAGGTSGGGGTSTGGTGGTAAGGTSGGGTLMACASGVTKNTPCTDSCGKTCGLKGVGATKAETCTGAPMMYMEGACTYPTGPSYACYHKTLPLAACPGTDAATGPTSGTTTCTSAECTPCGPAYQSSSGAKTGACVCVAGVYQCASDAEWPPQ